MPVRKLRCRLTPEVSSTTSRGCLGSALSSPAAACGPRGLPCLSSPFPRVRNGSRAGISRRKPRRRHDAAWTAPRLGSARRGRPAKPGHPPRGAAARIRSATVPGIPRPWEFTFPCGAGREGLGAGRPGLLPGRWADEDRWPRVTGWTPLAGTGRLERGGGGAPHFPVCHVRMSVADFQG